MLTADRITWLVTLVFDAAVSTVRPTFPGSNHEITEIATSYNDFDLRWREWTVSVTDCREPPHSGTVHTLPG